MFSWPKRKFFVICLLTKHLGVLKVKNSFQRVRVFQINLEVMVFKEMGKPENLEKYLSEQRREPTTN